MENFNPANQSPLFQGTPVPCSNPNPPKEVNIPPDVSGVHINIYQPSVAGPNGGMQTYPSSWYTGGYDTTGGASGAASSSAASAASSGNPPYANGGNGVGGSNNGSGSEVSGNGMSAQGYSYEDDPHYKSKRVKIITDDYIKSLEQWLNSQEVLNRRLAAKQVLSALQEDKRRFDDPALNALVNKMLQDPDGQVRVCALTALNARLAQGNDYTKGVLEKMAKNDASFGQDAHQAASILLQMAAPTKLVYQPIETGNRKAAQWQTATS